MSTFEEINNKALSPRERIAQAFDMLHPPFKDDEQFHAAKCYLTYRYLDGEITEEQYNKFIDLYVKYPKHEGLAVRWYISQHMAEAYVFIKLGDWLMALAKLSRVIEHFRNNGSLWPAQVNNFLRAIYLFSYYRYLSGNIVVVRYTLDIAIQEWKKSMQYTDFYQFPYRFTEMQEDYITLQAIMFLLHRCEHIEMNKYDWMTEDIIGKKWPYMMKNALVKMGEINKEKAIWK